MGVVDALAREVGSVGKLLRKLSPEQWRHPTRCPPLDVLQLTAHMARGAVRIDEMLAREAEDAEPEKDAVTFWQMDLDAMAPEIVARAQASAEEMAPNGPADMIRFWDERWVRALQAARAASDSVRRDPFGRLMRPSEFAKTRVVEVTVHHMDLDDALGIDPHPDAGCLLVVGDILRGLLGTDLRPVGMDDVRFVLTGTGRSALSDAEQEYLGPLADKFPLIR